MPIVDHAAAAQKIAAFLKTLTTTGGLRLKYRIIAGAGARDPDGLEAREIYVEMSGPDAVLLTQRGGELLRALEHIAAKIVRLEAEEHDTISFDANSFKALRARELKLSAETAAERVRSTRQPYSFAPMSSRERRMLHLAFRDFADLETESSGEGLRRFVVVYPKGAERPTVAATDSRVRQYRCTSLAAQLASLKDREARCSPIPTWFTRTKPSLPSRRRPAAAVLASYGFREPEATADCRADAAPAQSSGPRAGALCGICWTMETQEKLDEAVVTFFAAPAFLHRRRCARDCGARFTGGSGDAGASGASGRCARWPLPANLPQRAFLSGRIDLTQAEAVHDLIEAQTLYQARVAAQQMHGALSRRIKPIKEGLVALIALLEAGIDFAEDDVEVLPAAEILSRIAEIRGLLEPVADELRARAHCARGVDAGHCGAAERGQILALQPHRAAGARDCHGGAGDDARPGDGAGIAGRNPG